MRRDTLGLEYLAVENDISILRLIEIGLNHTYE